MRETIGIRRLIKPITYYGLIGYIRLIMSINRDYIIDNNRLIMSIDYVVIIVNNNQIILSIIDSDSTGEPINTPRYAET